MALDEDIITVWLLSKGKEMQLKRKKIEHGSATLLMETALKEIGAGVGVRCENRSLDELSDCPSSNREAVEENVQSLTSSPNSLRLLYDVIIGPIEDLLQGVIS